MAVKVGLENNILKIDDGVKILYHNAAWCDMDFSPTDVIITNQGMANKPSQVSVHIIPFTEFQDLAATPYATEAAIATYLSDKIG